MTKLLFLVFLPLSFFGQSFTKEEVNRWQQQAGQVTIIRDNWGVPHIYGKMDADAAFGLMYAQCEDNYWQLEESMIEALGRASEIYGEEELESDAAVALFECVERGKENVCKSRSFSENLVRCSSSGH